MAYHKGIWNKDGTPRKVSTHHNYPSTRYYNRYYKKNGQLKSGVKPAKISGSHSDIRTPRVPKDGVWFLKNAPLWVTGLWLIGISAVIIMACGFGLGWTHSFILPAIIVGSVLSLMGLVAIIWDIVDAIKYNRYIKQYSINYNDIVAGDTVIGPVEYCGNPFPVINYAYDARAIKNVYKRGLTANFTFYGVEKTIQCRNEKEAIDICRFIRKISESE